MKCSHRLMCVDTQSSDTNAGLERCTTFRRRRLSGGSGWAGLESLKPSSTSCSLSAACLTTPRGSDESVCTLLPLWNFLPPNFLRQRYTVSPQTRSRNKSFLLQVDSRQVVTAIGIESNTMSVYRTGVFLPSPRLEAQAPL